MDRMHLCFFLLIIPTSSNGAALTGRSHGVSFLARIPGQDQGPPQDGDISVVTDRNILLTDEDLHLDVSEPVVAFRGRSSCSWVRRICVEAELGPRSNPGGPLLPNLSLILVTLGLYSPSFRASLIAYYLVLMFRELITLRGKSIGYFHECSHGLRGEVVVLNERELLIQDFHYRGDAPAAWFHATRRGSPPHVHFYDESSSLTLPFPGTSCHNRLRNIVYTGQTLILILPVSIKELQTIGVFCYKYCHNFGHLVIPPNLEVEPAPDDLKVPLCPRPRYPFCSAVNEAAGCHKHISGRPTRVEARKLMRREGIDWNYAFNSSSEDMEDPTSVAACQFLPNAIAIVIMISFVTLVLLKIIE
ncbi:unnamed protein product [Orchesella dallaii]|uniref:DM13 domain-containing protein n=1 Tax=Orchesella dallaii TaxID=48710 RepID=A0ABP1PUE7_9HEXA